MISKRFPASAFIICIAYLATPSALGAEGRLVASDEPGWPQWWGPRRDAISTETGLLETWPEGGPKLLWSADGMGKGYAAPIVAGGAIFITGDFGTELKVMALTLDGRRKWSVANGRAWAKPHPGSRSSCTYAGGPLYHMNAHGRLLWKHVHELPRGMVALTPNYSRGHLFVPECSRTGNKSLCLNLDPRTGAPGKAWVMETANFTGSAVLKGGIIVASDSRKLQWYCIDAATGEMLHRKKGLKYGSSVYADGRYYCVCSDGVVLMMKVDRQAFTELSRFKLVEKKGDVWAHPVICGGRLYLRYHDRLYCYDVRGR